MYIYIYLCVFPYVLWHGVTLIPWPPQELTPLRFPVWLGIRKPMIPYPLLRKGAVLAVGSHLGRIPNCSEVPPPPPENRPTRRSCQNHHLPEPPPPPRGLRPTVSWGGGGVVGVQNRGVAPSGQWTSPCAQLLNTCICVVIE